MKNTRNDDVNWSTDYVDKRHPYDRPNGSICNQTEKKIISEQPVDLAVN